MAIGVMNERCQATTRAGYQCFQSSYARILGGGEYLCRTHLRVHLQEHLNEAREKIFAPDAPGRRIVHIQQRIS